MDYKKLKCGAIVFESKIIFHPKGEVLHGIKKSDEGFIDFGEVYFSKINCGEVKGWKKHTQMFMNIFVPVGTIQFYLEEDGKDLTETVRIGEGQYGRLFVPPGVWMAFEGIGEHTNLLTNFASIAHNPEESLTREFLK